jgi:hypothetical protein
MDSNNSGSFPNKKLVQEQPSEESSEDTPVINVDDVKKSQHNANDNQDIMNVHDDNNQPDISECQAETTDDPYD